MLTEEKLKIKFPTVLLSATGYLLVAATCQFAGNFFRDGEPNYSLYQILLLFPLFFFYFSWVIIYDYRKLNEKTQEGLLHGILALLYFAALLIPIFVIKNSYPTLSRDLTQLYLASNIPFLILGIYLIICTKDNRLELTFRTFIFSPALITCVVPFMHGFLKPTEIAYVWWISIGLSIFVILLVFKRIYQFSTLTFLLIFLVLSAISFFYYDSFTFSSIKLNETDLKIIRAFVVATDMALVMGLAESWWFVKDTRNTDFKAEDKNMSFYVKGVDTATSSLPFLVPFLILHKSSNLFTFFMIFLAIFWYRFYEKRFKVNNTKTNWKLMRIVFGLSIPIAFVLSTWNLPLFKPENVYNLNSLNFVLFSLIAFSMGVLTIIRNSMDQDEVTKLFKPKKIVTITFCMFMFLVCWGFEFYSQPQRTVVSKRSYKLLNNEISLDSIEDNSYNIIINQNLSVFRIDTSKNLLVKDSSIILDFSDKNNEELKKRAGIAKLIYALIFVFLILKEPIVRVYKKMGPPEVNEEKKSLDS